MASIISPKIPENPIRRNGFLNKTQIMRDLLNERPNIDRNDAINFLMTTKKAATPTTFEHAATIYRNVTEENRRLEITNGKKSNIPTLTASTSKKQRNQLQLMELVASIATESPLSLSNFNSGMTPAQQFEQFLDQFKTICRNEYARGLARTCLDLIDENEATKKLG